MTTRLVILGLLRQQPLYGYEIKQIIEQDMGEWTSIAYGSIYFALARLAEEGFVEKIATRQEGNRPSRTVFQITYAGREEFMRLLHQVWGSMERQYFDLDVGLAFMEALPLDEVKEYLRRRQASLEVSLQGLDEQQKTRHQRPDVNRLAAVVFNHSRLHLRAELDWIRDLLTKIERGDYP